jgi:predicted transcriptional regulator
MLTHGGKREGAGRKPKAATGPSAAIAIRLPDELRQRLRLVTEALDISQAEVMEMGIELAETRLAAQEYE